MENNNSDKKIIIEDYRNIDDDFNRFLKKNAEEVCKWPSWKLDIWGPISEQYKREQ